MKYYKIAELANLCQTKRSMINELESELQKLGTRLKKEIV